MFEQVIAQTLVNTAGTAELAEVFGPGGDRSFLNAGPSIAPTAEDFEKLSFVAPLPGGKLVSEGVQDVFRLWRDITMERGRLLQAA